MKPLPLFLAALLVSGVASAQSHRPYYYETEANGNSVACTAGTCTRDVPVARVRIDLLGHSGRAIQLVSPDRPVRPPRDMGR